MAVRIQPFPTRHGVEEGVGKRVDGNLWWVLYQLLPVFLEGIRAQLYALG